MPASFPFHGGDFLFPPFSNEPHPSGRTSMLIRRGFSKDLKKIAQDLENDTMKEPAELYQQIFGLSAG
jgi:hypothetical protein